MRTAAVSLALLALAATGARAEEAQPLAGPDTQFLAKAIQDGMAEVDLGKTAEKKASSPEVKRFAERMVKDHARGEQEARGAGQEAQDRGQRDLRHAAAEARRAGAGREGRPVEAVREGVRPGLRQGDGPGSREGRRACSGTRPRTARTRRSASWPAACSRRWRSTSRWRRLSPSRPADGWHPCVKCGLIACEFYRSGVVVPSACRVCRPSVASLPADDAAAAAVKQESPGG